jgi:hypothetical protein
MNPAKSSDRDHRTPLAPARACPCCGKIVVLLRVSNLPPEQFRYVAVYIKTWDGNPWYVPGTHKRHFRKPYAIYMDKQRPPTDPFFSLD